MAQQGIDLSHGVPAGPMQGVAEACRCPPPSRPSRPKWPLNGLPPGAGRGGVRRVAIARKEPPDRGTMAAWGPFECTVGMAGP